MKILLDTLLIIFTLGAVFVLIVWVLALGSGHKIPGETTKFFLFVLAGALSMSILMLYVRKLLLKAESLQDNNKLIK